MKDNTLLERFIGRVKILPTGCWQWTGSLKPHGYGHFGADGKLYRAHRWAYEFFRGPIPKTLCLDHLCRNRGCVNPQHLEAVSLGDNIRRGNTGLHMKRKTHCPQGHPYSGKNLYINPRGKRNCRICAKVSYRKFMSRKAKE